MCQAQFQYGVDGCVCVGGCGECKILAYMELMSFQEDTDSK